MAMAHAQTPAPAQAPAERCATCLEMKAKQLPGKTLLVSEEDLMEAPGPELPKKAKKKLKQGKEREFLRNLDALMNAGGGILCLHVENVHMLGLFDQSVNTAMAALISDNSTFPENFERHLKDDNHVIFRVKQKERSLSSVSFHTKISYDKGVEDATHGQMTHLLLPPKPEDGRTETAPKRTGVKYTFKKDEEVKVKVAGKRKANTGQEEEVVFQESINAQAKKIPKPPSGRTAEKSEKLINLFFDEENKPGTFLPKYFSAFSKLQAGGSILLGVEEDKETSRKWAEVQKEDREKILTFKDPKLKLWSHEKEGTTQYVFGEECPLEQEEIERETGVFKCQGVRLNDQEQSCFRKDIIKKAKDLMYWHPGVFAEDKTNGSDSPTFKPPVDVTFNKVENGPSGLVVPEITVGHYKGMAFIGTEGPEAYYIQTATLAVKRMTMEIWFEEFKKLLCEKCHMPRHVDSCQCGE